MLARGLSRHAGLSLLQSRRPLALRCVSTVTRASAAVPRAVIATAAPLSLAFAATKIACAMPKRKGQPQPRASDVHATKWTGTAEDRVVKYDKNSPTLIEGGEKIPLLPGQRVGDSKKDWVPYFASAANAATKHAMIEKVMNMSLSDWPLDMKRWSMDKLLDAFEKMGLPFQPYTIENWPGCRRHPENEGYQTGAQRQRAGQRADAEKRRKRFLKARRRGEHRDRQYRLVVNPSEPARRSHAYRRKADALFFKRGFTDVPAWRIGLKALQRAYPRWPLYTTDLHCAGCLGHVLLCASDTNYEHVHGQGPLGGSERTCCTGQSCGQGHLVVVDWFRQTCGATDDDIKGFAGHLAEFVRPGGVKPGASTFLDLAARAAKASRRSGAADGATGGAAVFDADALAPAEPLLTRARRMPPQRADVVLPGAGWAPAADDVTRVFFDVEATRLEGDVEVVQLALVAPQARARYVEFVEPEGSISYGAFQIHGISKGMLGKLDARGFADVFDDAAAWLVKVRGDGDLVLVAHNGDDFDFPVLDALAKDVGREPLNCARLDTIKIARRVFPGRTGSGSYNLARLYGDATREPLVGHHGALADARALEPVLAHLVKAGGGDVEAYVRRFAAAYRKRAAAHAGRRASAALEDEAAERGDAAAADDDDADDDASALMDTSPPAPAPPATARAAPPAPSGRRRDAVAVAPAELSPAAVPPEPTAAPRLPLPPGAHVNAEGETIVRIRRPPPPPPPLQDEPAAASTDDGPSAEDVGKMKVTELRAALEARGLSTEGLKAVLKERLLDALDDGGDEPEPKRRRQTSPSPSPPQRAKPRVSLGRADPEEDDDDDAPLAEDAAGVDDVESSRADRLLRTLDAAESACVEAMAEVAALPGATEPLPATFDLDGLAPGQLAELACRASAKLAEKARGARSFRDELVEEAERAPLSIVKRVLEHAGRYSSSDDDAEAVVRDRYLELLLEEAGAAP